MKTIILGALLCVSCGDYQLPNGEKIKKFDDEFYIYDLRGQRQHFSVYHDVDRKVTCYFGYEAMSCVRDAEPVLPLKW